MTDELFKQIDLFKILLAVVIMASAVLIAKIVAASLRRALSDRLKRDQLEILVKISYYLIIFLGFVTITPLFGVSLSGLLVAGGITGIVLGFASQSVVSNFISGLFLLWEKPIKIGDQINVDNIAGFVEDIHIMSTIIRTYDGIFVRIPNEKVFTSNITNYVANVARRFEYVIGIRYADDANRAIEIIRDLIDREPFALKYPEPQVFVDNLGDSSVNIVVRIWAPSREWFDVKMKLLWNIKVELEKNGIEIPFPQRVIWFANEMKIHRES
uniref:Mechanosensitive ion channel family protein n=1 Tax=Geoglobus ahangari TaxID=113653 RepID=A0A7C3UHU0_9EURY